MTGGSFAKMSDMIDTKSRIFDLCTNPSESILKVPCQHPALTSDSPPNVPSNAPGKDDISSRLRRHVVLV